MMEVSDNVSYEPVAGRAPLILGGHDFHSITTAVATPAEQATPLAWWFFFIPSLGMLGLLGLAEHLGRVAGGVDGDADEADAVDVFTFVPLLELGDPRHQ